MPQSPPVFHEDHNGISRDEEEKAAFILSLRKAQIHDEAVMNVMLSLDRKDFIEGGSKIFGYQDAALEIGHGQTISQPSLVAMMTQFLSLTRRHRVLEIGTGSGYQTMILAKLSRFVYSVERIEALKQAAEKRFYRFSQNNIVTRLGDGHLGWPEQAPFERIMVTAAFANPPLKLYKQMADKAIMIYPLGERDTMQKLIKAVKQGHEIQEEELMNVRFVPMRRGIDRPL